jgi:hypothetical protein
MLRNDDAACYAQALRGDNNIDVSGSTVFVATCGPL